MGINKNIVQYEERRIFIDVAYEGCGSGCIYCYSSTSSKHQKLITLDDIDILCKEIETYCSSIKDYVIISFCPNTEPFKSEESCKLVLMIIEKLMRKNFIFQVATKELIPDFVLSKLNSLSMFEEQIFINISIPYLLNKNTIEPKASNINNRLNNFNYISQYRNLRACLYIKPFNKSVMLHIDKYIHIIRSYKIDFICVGMSFCYQNKALDICRTMYREEMALKSIECNNLSEIRKAIDVFENEGVPVFLSTTCIIANSITNECEQKLYDYSEDMCQNCKLRRL